MLSTLQFCYSKSVETLREQENRWKPGMLPKCLLSVKGRTFNATPLVHKDMIKKTNFYGKKGEIT